MLDVENNTYKWTLGYVKKQKGEVRGQGTSKDDPLAIFGNHIEVELELKGNPMFFDPSYGKTYEGANRNDRLAALQVGALDFLGLHSLDEEDKNTVLVRFRDVDSKDQFGKTIVRLKAVPINR